MKNPKRSSEAWERSNYLNWEKSLRKYRARSAPSAGQKDCLFCTCGQGSRLSQEKKRKTREEIDALSIPYFVAKKKELIARCKAWNDSSKSTITSKRMNQRDMRKRKDMVPLRSGSKVMNCTEILSSPCLDSLMAIDFSYTSTRIERPRFENSYTLGANGQGPKPKTKEEKCRLSASGKQNSGYAKSSGESKSVNSQI